MHSLERLASLVFDIPIRFILSLYLFRHPFRLTIGDRFSTAHKVFVHTLHLFIFTYT